MQAQCGRKENNDKHTGGVTDPISDLIAEWILDNNFPEKIIPFDLSKILFTISHSIFLGRTDKSRGIEVKNAFDSPRVKSFLEEWKTAYDYRTIRCRIRIDLGNVQNKKPVDPNAEIEYERQLLKINNPF